MIRNQITLLALGLFSVSQSFAASKISRSQYVEQWKDIAISEMIDHKIPASITLAQAILESGSGNSYLATNGKNHFGIKCHGWEGEEIYLDDDKSDECFRVYQTAEESFQDHSDFLLKYDRYAFLFDLKTSDYKAWAKGLRKAGYATNPKYPELLIKLIEDLNLDQYDVLGDVQVPEAMMAENSDTKKDSKKASSTITMRNEHKVYLHNNKVKYVIADKGDTYYQISKEFNLTLSQLYRYNSFESEKSMLLVGDVVYIQPKKKGKLFKKENIELNEDMTVVQISQKYAVSTRSLTRLNSFSDDEVIPQGELVTLR